MIQIKFNRSVELRAGLAVNEMETGEFNCVSCGEEADLRRRHREFARGARVNGDAQCCAPDEDSAALIQVKSGNDAPGSISLQAEAAQLLGRMEMEHVTADKLMQDMRAVVVDSEELLKATAGQAGERIEKIRAKTEESLRFARRRLQDAGQAVQASARDAARNVDDQVHKNPWTAVGVAAGVGLVVGILIGRR